HALDAPPPYELTAHAVTQGTTYSVADVADALRELSTWFANAELSLVRIQRQMVGRKLAASDVRCWPHHFDLATLVSFPAREVIEFATGIPHLMKGEFTDSAGPGIDITRCVSRWALSPALLPSISRP